MSAHLPCPIPVPPLVAMQAAVSAASLVVEIVAGRMLAPYVGMSLYTWTSIIAVVLAGFSAGHWLGGYIAERDPAQALRQTGWTMIGAALTSAAAVLVLKALAGPVLTAMRDPVAGITVLAALVFFLPSFLAGVPAPVLARLAVISRDRPGRSLGAMFAAGALGAIGGTLLAGFVFISWLGSVGTMAVVTVTYLLVALACFRLAGGNRRQATMQLLVGLLALALAAASLAGPSPCTVESRYFCIRVIDLSDDPAAPVRLMVIDHLGHGISARNTPETLQTDHAAMLDALARTRTAGRPFDAFFIGGGSYSIPRAWAARGLPVRMTVAEIDPAVTEVARSDFWFDAATTKIRHDDARRVLREDPARYDVIIGDAFTDIAVPAHLVTREFFELVAARLHPDGVYLMNVIDYANRLQALAAIVATLRDVFPVVEVWVEQRRPEPGERMVFIVLAGTTPTPKDALTTRAPETLRFAALADRSVDAMVARGGGLILTDDFAPIDRLIGRAD